MSQEEQIKKRVEQLKELPIYKVGMKNKQVLLSLMKHPGWRFLLEYLQACKENLNHGLVYSNISEKLGDLSDTYRGGIKAYQEIINLEEVLNNMKSIEDLEKELKNTPRPSGVSGYGN